MLRASIIIPTYNYSNYILKAIHSITEQDYPQELIEIIVVDDGSIDDTALVLKPLVEGRKLHYHYQENKGKAAATRKGIELASGDIIFNLDADDYFLPEKIEATVEIFMLHPEVVHVANPASILFEDGRPSETESIPVSLLDKPMEGADLLRYFFEHKMLYGGGSCFAGRAIVLKSIIWDDAIDMYTDEWLLMETLLKGKSYFLPKPLSVWRIHGKNYSVNTDRLAVGKRHQRLSKSSEAILNLVSSKNYPPWLVRLYRLKHEVRKMVWLEEAGEKSVQDIIVFFRNVIITGMPISILTRYHAFNRLIPMQVSRVLKN